MPTTEQTPETMENTEHTPDIPFLAGHYLTKGIAWLLIAMGCAAYTGGFGFYQEDQTGAAILVLAGVYLLVNTKKK